MRALQQRLTDNLRGYTLPDIRLYSDLLLGRDRVDDQMGFDNGIISLSRMECAPQPCALQDFYEGDPELPRSAHFFMRGMAEETWGPTAL